MGSATYPQGVATPSLYRRYRPRRFSELKGQDHVVDALRNAVVNGREGQAYLFSGPRGTGKTSSARILAKVLNCTNPIDGEPCCECASCKSVEAGTSFDVHELDAASNNGVDAMRDLIERSMLGTPGRHKVYILDEVHMLSKGAEAALLKTLEEPPPHVVFVLATTDPQKVSETIISRTQHLQFHLLAMDVMEDHVRWLIGDAGLTIDEDAVDAVLRQGRGSARDTLSALELVVTSGGHAPQETPLDEFVESLIEQDPARALTAVAASMHRGRDARGLAEEVVGHLRDCFLALMAPELVTLPDRRATEVGALAQRLGAAGAVRAIETIGSTLVEMRHAPDPRVLLEVALVKLTSVAADTGTAALLARIERLEQQLATGVGPAAISGSTPATRSTPGAAGPIPAARSTGVAPGSHREVPTASAGPSGPTSTVTSSQGRPVAGGGTPDTAPSATPARSVGSVGSASGRPVLGGRLAGRSTINPDGGAAETTTVDPSGHPSVDPEHAGSPPQGAPEAPDDSQPRLSSTTSIPSASSEISGQSPAENSAGSGIPSAPAGPADASCSPGVTDVGGARDAPSADHITRAWTETVLPGLRPLVKARYAAGRLEYRDDGLLVTFPNDAHRKRCDEHRAAVEAALAHALGSSVRVTLTAEPDGGASPSSNNPGPANEPPAAEEDIDLSELVDAPPAGRMSGIDRVTAAFPGAQLIEEDH